MGKPFDFAGRSWWYEFSQLPSRLEEDNVSKYSQRLLKHLAGITKGWTSDLNSEWTVRVFFAVKMVFSASIMAQSLRFAESNNLRSVVSYLQYYTVLHSLRAVVLTNPHVAWNGGEILQKNHFTTINIAADTLAKFDRDISNQVKQNVLYLKAFRELISYRAPSSGDNFAKPAFDVYELAVFFLEIAQLQSELLETSIEKNVTESFKLDQTFTDYVSNVEIEGIHFHDDEDWSRIDYLARKHPRPANMLHLMSEGHVEDYFGSWCAEDPQPGAFNPDEDWQILFDVP